MNIYILYICARPTSHVNTRGGHAKLFLKSTIAISQFEGRTSAIATPQLLKECCSATATLQFHNRTFFWSPQLQVHNFKSATWEFHFRNFRHIFGRGVAWNYMYFLPLGAFCYSEVFKRTVAWYFWSLFFREPFPYENKLGYESGIRSIHEKHQRTKISCYCPFKASFWFPYKQTVLKIFFVYLLNHPELRKRD